MTQPRYNDPFYFAIKDGTPTIERAQVPANIRSQFGINGGSIFFVRDEPGFRLYKIAAFSQGGAR